MGERPTGGLHFAVDSLPGAGATVASWSDYVAAESLGRIQAGVHFRYSNEAAEAMGRAIGRMALTQFAPPLP